MVSKETQIKQIDVNEAWKRGVLDYNEALRLIGVYRFDDWKQRFQEAEEREKNRKPRTPPVWRLHVRSFLEKT